MIDPELITRKSKLIAQDLAEIEKISEKTLDEYLGDKTSQVIVERYLERILTRTIDINYHIIAEQGHAPPSDYFQSFTQLGEIRALPADFAREIAPSAGLRNRLVHEYDEIDPNLIYQAIKTALLNIPKYLDYINKFLKKITS